MHSFPDSGTFYKELARVVGPERRYYRLILVYSMAISLLTLAIPISVQTLIDTVANIGVSSAVVTVGIMLFALLLVSGILQALRAYTMELSNRALFGRMASEIALVGLLSAPGWFAREQHAALCNRYFDIMTIKKNVPYLFSQAFSIFFQSVIGFIVVSLYHIYFLVFSVCLVLLLWLLWALSGWRAIETGFRLSDRKHATGAWLQRLSTGNAFFKASQPQAFALQQTDELINAHLDAQQSHFRVQFGQLVFLLFIYALASAVLLGIGGWLVVQGQLTLGQLVAAELIMSAIFYSLPQLAGYLDYFYDVCAAAEELLRLRGIASESREQGPLVPVSGNGPFVSRGTRCADLPQSGSVTFTLQPGTRAMAKATSPALQHTFTSLLDGSLARTGGTLTFAETDIDDYGEAERRRLVQVPSRQPFPPLGIRDYLRLAGADVSAMRLHDGLELLELGYEIAELPEGLDTSLAADGQPLRLDQALRLKLVFALFGDSRLLVLDQQFMTLPHGLLRRFMEAYTNGGARSVICFTAGEHGEGFTHALDIGTDKQSLRAL
jgi:putative ABC transport system ATP-binding protein